jgi:hypothetical protein
VWAMDITYIPMARGFVYLAVVLDWFNPDYCRPFKDACIDRKSQPTPFHTGGRMLSFVLGHGLHTLDRQLKPEGSKQVFTDLEVGYDGLNEFLPQRVQFGGAISADDACEDIVRGSLALYGMDEVAQARRLLALIPSKDHYTKALKWIIRSHFGDPEWEPHNF